MKATNFTFEKFQKFFDKVKDKVYDFNDKIYQDLQSKDSKLHEFIGQLV